jgi:predicted urease superfamily metal-dependent hydrolase
MSDNTKANIATADALTLLLHNQHAICAAIEELTKWLADNGVGNVAVNAMAAMQTLDMNAQGITDAIMRLRHS